MSFNLKIFIDKKANKVAFAEADKGFVDFIFDIPLLPLGTVWLLTKSKRKLGCIGDVCKSMKSLDHARFLDRHFKVFTPTRNSAGYTKDGVSYIVMDNLEVKPMSFSFIKSMFKDIDSLEQRKVKVRPQEVS